MVLKHVLDIQIFKRNQAKTVHQSSANLMSKFIPLVSDPLMDQFNDF